jgi:hypothetical protein
MINSAYRFGPVRITYGDAVDLSPFYGRRITGELLHEVTDLLMSRLAELGGISPAVSEPEPDVVRIPSAG